MTSVEVAVKALTSIVDSEAYKTGASWVTAKEFKISYINPLANRPFQLDRTLEPKTSYDKKRP